MGAKLSVYTYVTYVLIILYIKSNLLVIKYYLSSIKINKIKYIKIKTILFVFGIIFITIFFLKHWKIIIEKNDPTFPEVWSSGQTLLNFYFSHITPTLYTSQISASVSLVLKTRNLTWEATDIIKGESA